MKRFAALFQALDQTTGTNAKVAALADYFASAPEADRLWTIALLSGRRPRRLFCAQPCRETCKILPDNVFSIFQEPLSRPFRWDHLTLQKETKP